MLLMVGLKMEVMLNVDSLIEAVLNCRDPCTDYLYREYIRSFLTKNLVCTKQLAGKSCFC